MSSNPKATHPELANIKTIETSNDHKFRQTRFENEEGLLKIFVGKTEFKLINWSRIGVGFADESKHSSRMKREQVLDDVQIRLDDQVLYSGRVEICNVVSRDSELLYGALFRSNLFLAEGIETAIEARKVRRKVEEFQSQLSSIDPKIYELIVRMRCFLNEVKSTCETVEHTLSTLSLDRRVEAERAFLSTASDFTTNLIKDFNKRVATQIDIDKLAPNSIYHQLFEREIYPFFASGDIATRAKDKPRGYAGDYEMMNQIYRNGFEGKDLLGKLIHSYIVNEDSSNSVRFRKPFFRSYYEELRKQSGGKFVLNIACGPAVEVQEIVAAWPQADLERIHITLFDLDRAALEHAQNMIFENCLQHGKSPSLQFINASVKSFLSQNAKVNGKYDFIYSGGLFDYLDNDTSKALTEKLFDILNPGGRLVIGNFTKKNTTKAFCHLITQWHLIHKTEEDILGWASDLKNARKDLRFDTQQINAFLEIEKMK